MQKKYVYRQKSSSKSVFYQIVILKTLLKIFCCGLTVLDNGSISVLLYKRIVNHILISIFAHLELRYMTNFFCAAVFLLLCFQTSYGQKKTLSARRISTNISIDGQLTEPEWAEAAVATDFVMFAPDNGKPVSPEKRTDVKVLYDNDAIYISAIMFDDEPEKMLKEVTQRDVFGSSEHFGVFINGFNDGQQDFQFFLSAAGVQMDCIATEANGEDYTWDAIWSGQVTVTDFGWIAEMKIPYAALRFSDAAKQTWGINFYREFRRDRQQYTWNRIDNQVGATITQSGILQGIENIKPPTRLFFIPYSSYYYEKSATENKHTLKGGLDIKYGINDSFTLDAILVPDFGQTRYDNVELNLGPFEQQFNENRPFFTEGTDLFNKGNLLYSRRIGGSPSTFLTTDNPDVVVTNPTTVNLINAIKLSGRLKNGLGIGILNAVTEPTYAYARDTSTNDRDKVLVEPLTNYNVFVLDQRFNKNSSVSFVNTNVIRDGNFRDANVSAAVFDLNTKENTYRTSGYFKYSYINQFGIRENTDGFDTTINFEETSGKYRYGAGALYVSKDYDNNDLGINFYTDYHGYFGNASYRILNPTKRWNSFEVYLNPYVELNNKTGHVQQANVSLNINAFTRKNNYWGLGISGRPVETYDFYEPRIANRFVYFPTYFNAYVYYSSNYNNKFAIDIQPSINITDESKRESWGFFIAPRYRFTDRITANVSFNYARNNNNVGYIDDTYIDDATAYEIYFAKRNRSTYTFSAGGKYSINKDMTVNLSARYYWSYAENREFFILSPNGYLIPATYDQNQNSDFNTWNLDLSYTWWFAPGSQISLLYRNNSNTFTREIVRDLGSNFNNLFKENLQHMFSISIRYYIDYNQAKNWF